MPSPRPMSIQNSRAFGEAVLTLARNATVAPSRRTFCRMSPKAVSANPRGARTDNKTCEHTTAHTIAVHFRAFWSGEFPTLEIVCLRELAYALPE